MTRPRIERLATRPCAPATPPRAHVPDLDATARALERIITEKPCGCWLVELPGGEITVPCGAHDTEWWQE